MNNNFNYDPNFNGEITMSAEEKKSHKSIFSKLCLAALAYLVIVEVLAVLVGIIFQNVAPELLKNGNFSLIASSVLQYCIAFPIFYLIIRKMPRQAPVGEKMSIGRFIKYFFVSMTVMWVGNYISTYIMTYVESYLGEAPENAVDTVLNSTDVLLSALIVGIIGPIIEELMFRKLFIDRLTPYGDVIAILFPALMFGLFHGNLYQFFYAFFLGATFSYIYVKTGKIIYSIILHMFINLYCGVFPSYIMTLVDLDELLELSLTGAITEEYIEANSFAMTLFSIYGIGMLFMVAVGFFTLMRNLKNIRLNRGAVKFPKGSGAEIIFFNAGAIALIAVCLIVMALNTFTV